MKPEVSGEIAESENQNFILYRVIDSIPDNISFKNLEGRYLGCNAAFVRSIGMNRCEIIGRTDYELFDRNLADCYRAYDQSVVAQGKPRHNNEWIIYTDGRRVLVDIHISPLRDSEDRIIGVTCISKNTTDRKDTNDEMRQADVLLKKAADISTDMVCESESADSIKSEFLAKMSHEIRTPLNGVIVMSRLMLETTLTDRQRRYADVVKSSAEMLLSIVNDILDFSKIDAGKLDIEHIQFSIDDVICNTLDCFWDRAAEKNIHLHATISPAGPEWVVGDKLRLSQILNNLMSNAIKFTDSGGNIHLSVDLRYQFGQTVVINIAVQDSGIGITEKQLSTIFNAFSQADKSTTRNYGGTGLGLTICKQLCELMGGRIRVNSTPGKGSKFSFFLPFELPVGMADSSFSETAWTGKNVLVAADNPTTRFILSKLLSVKSSLVRCACSGQEVLNLLLEADNSSMPFDLCLLDHHMPLSNGIETAQWIRQENLSAMPAILLMVTSRDRIELRDAAESAGIRGFITKPIRPSTLLQEIQSALFGTTLKRSKNIDFPEARDSGIRILTVEDNEINQEVIIELLRVIGIDTDIARNGREAVEKVRLLDYDVVFMDIQMPVMDGIEATRAIRNLNKPGIDKLPIYAMTAHAMKDELKKIKHVGMNGYITKPIDIEQLIALLKLFIPEAKKRNVSINGKTAVSTELDSGVETLQIPGIDIAEGIRLLNGNRELHLSLLKKFANDDSYMVTKELLQDDPKMAYRRVHSIRSIAANLGGTQLASVAAELEKTLHNGIKNDDLLQEFILRNNALRSDIATFFTGHGNDNHTAVQQKPMGNDAEFRHILNELRNSIADNEPTACKEIMKLVLAKHWPGKNDADITELNDLIHRYRFEAASTTLVRLMAIVDYN